MKVLEDAEQVINEMKKEGKKNKNKKNLNVLSAKLARLRGKVCKLITESQIIDKGSVSWSFLNRG